MNKTRNLVVAVIGAVALLALVVVAGGVFSRSQSVQAQTTPVSGTNGQGVEVSGQGVVVVKPDLVKLTIGVQERGSTVQEAQQKVNTKKDAITKALTDLKISPDDIQTTDYNISPVYRSDNSGNSTLQGYGVMTTLQVTIRKLEDAGKVIDGATGAGANQIGNIQFTLDNSTAAVKQARLAALQDAKAKADQLAAAGGFQTGAVIDIKELGTNVPVRPVSVASGAAPVAPDAGPTNLEAGQFRVEVAVDVIYAIK